jgi:hypothetical protein
MSNYNALLIRWKSGYTTVGATSAPIRRGYLELGSIETEAEAKRLGNKELARISGIRDQITLGADPDPINPDDAYGAGWDIGDYVITYNRQGTTSPVRVLQVAVAEDDDGMLSVLPQLSSLLEQREIRMQRWLTRMSNGTMNGTSEVASPIVTPEYVPGRRPNSTTQTFSWNPITTTRTSPWTPEVAGRLAQMHLRRTGSNVGEVRVAFIVNGVTLDEGIIWDGDEEGIFGGTGVDFRPGDKLELEPTEIAGADNLTIRVIQTHYH